MSSRPPSGDMCYWRFKGTGPYKFGYCTYLSGGLIRLGSYNGDTMGGSIVDPWEIEWKRYSRY